MSLVPIYVLGLACLAVIALWCVSRSYRVRLEAIAPLLAIIANIAALTVFWSLFWTVAQTRKEQELQSRTEQARFNARMIALRSEISFNIDVCDKILNEKEQYVQAIAVPYNMFVFNTIEESLRSGELTYNKLRNEIRNTYHRMLWANRVMENDIQLLYLQAFAVLEQQEKINVRIRSDMQDLMKRVEEIKVRLRKIDLLFYPFMENPQKYNETVTFGSPEHYQKPVAETNRLFERTEIKRGQK